MRILLLSREYPPHVYGGAGVVVDHLSRALARRASVEVRCFGDQQQTDPPLTVKGYAPWPRLAGGPEAPYAPALEALSVGLAMARDPVAAELALKMVGERLNLKLDTKKLHRRKKSLQQLGEGSLPSGQEAEQERKREPTYIG